MKALTCLQCGGPLGAVKAIPAVVECSFCGAVIDVSERPVVTRRGTPDELRANRIRDGRVKFLEELTALCAAHTAPFEAVRTAAAHHLGTGGETDTLARVTIALAEDFEKEHPGVPVVGDAMVLCRVAQAYLQCVHELQTTSETEINLPYIATGKGGPVHFLRRITPSELAALAERDPRAATPIAPAQTPRATPPIDEAPPESPPKKKGWWPFG